MSLPERSATRRTPWGVIDQFVSAATNSAAVLMASHRLGDDDFGRLALSIVIAIIVISGSKAFTSSPFVIDHAADDPNERRHQLSAAFGGAVRVGAVLAGVLALTGFILGEGLGHLLVVLAGGTVALVVQDLARYGFFVVGPAHGAALSDITWFVVFLVPALVLPDVVDSAAAILALWLIGAAAGAVVAAVSLHRSGVTQVLWRMPWIRRHRDLSLNVLGDTALLSLYGYSIPLFVAAFAGVDAAGSYRLAQTLVGPVMIVVSSLSLELLPAMVQAHRRGHQVAVTAARAGLVVAATALVVAVGAVVVPDAWMDTLIGRRWDDTGALTVVLAVSAAATAIGTSALLVLRATGGQALLTRTRALFFPAHLALVLVGSMLWGAMGAAVGLLVGNALSLAPWWWLAVRHERQTAAA